MRRPWLYLAILLGAPVLLLIGLCLLLPTPWFAAHSADPYLANLGYGATLRHVNCDIVLDGDSTAEVGLDPAVFEQQTHLKTCNIAEPDGVRVVNGNTILDQYLAHNTPPRLILFLFNAPNLNPGAYPGEIGLFEGFTYRMRQPQALSYALHHPSLTAKWLRTDLPLWAHILSHPHPAPMPNRSATGGRLALEGEPRQTCSALRMPAPPDAAWLRSLRTHYSGPHTSVLIDVMPVADCDSRFPDLQQKLKGTTDNELTTLPVTDFLQQGPHMTSAGAAVLSREIAQQLTEYLQERVAIR